MVKFSLELTKNPLKTRFFRYFTYTVGTYSPGKLSVVYEINIQVLPTVPSPTTTHLIGRPEDISLTLNQISQITSGPFSKSKIQIFGKFALFGKH